MMFSGKGRARAATEADVPALAGVSARSLIYVWSEEDFLDTMKNPQARVYVFEAQEGEAAGRVVGYVILYFAADEGEVASVGVEPEFRRRGVARRIFDYMFACSDEHGVKKYFLEVRESNEPAQRLYEAMGFLRIGVRKEFYDSPTEDAFLMMRDGSSAH